MLPEGTHHFVRSTPDTAKLEAWRVKVQSLFVEITDEEKKVRDLDEDADMHELFYKDDITRLADEVLGLYERLVVLGEEYSPEYDDFK